MIPTGQPPSTVLAKGELGTQSQNTVSGQFAMYRSSTLGNCEPSQCVIGHRASFAQEQGFVNDCEPPFCRL